MPTSKAKDPDRDHSRQAEYRIIVHWLTVPSTFRFAEPAPDLLAGKPTLAVQHRPHRSQQIHHIKRLLDKVGIRVQMASVPAGYSTGWACGRAACSSAWTTGR